MSSTPTLSSLNAETETYPSLTAAQIDRLRPSSRLRSVEAGEVLYRQGDHAVPLFVLLTAHVEVVQPDADRDLLSSSIPRCLRVRRG